MDDQPTVLANEAALPPTERRLHRALLDAVIAKGVVPAADALAAAVAIDPDALPEHLGALARADYLAFDGAGRLTCLYPFSAVPTPHVVVIGGERRFAMCSLDALGVAAMLGRPIEIESSCAACGTPIGIAVQPGVVASVHPVGTVVVVKRASDAPAADTCCAFTVFACGPAHASDLIARTPETSVVDPSMALSAGEALFGNLLGAVLPATRSRVRWPSREVGAGRPSGALPPP